MLCVVRPCSYARDQGWSGAASVVRDKVIHAGIPLARAYVRYGPGGSAKQWFWERIADVFLTWHTRQFTARTVFGARMTGNTSDVLPQYLYWFGIWEPNLTRFLQRRLQPGDVVVDVGANAGYFSLLSSSLVGQTGSVVAVEAARAAAECLATNIKLNGVTNIRAVNVAAVDHERRVTLFLGSMYHTSATSIVPADSFTCGGEVDGVPLSKILTADEIARVRVIKIDVEGAEAEVVAGMGSMLDSVREDLEIVVEIDPRRMAQLGRTVDDVLSVFIDRGFFAYRIDNDYRSVAYVAFESECRPTRIRTPIVSETDVVLSRIDADVL